MRKKWGDGAGMWILGEQIDTLFFADDVAFFLTQDNNGNDTKLENTFIKYTLRINKGKAKLICSEQTWSTDNLGPGWGEITNIASLSYL